LVGLVFRDTTASALRLCSLDDVSASIVRIPSMKDACWAARGYPSFKGALPVRVTFLLPAGNVLLCLALELV
jgi:hypothetical protein